MYNKSTYLFTNNKFSHKKHMKLTTQSALAASSLAVGVLLGASALVAMADSTWTTAPGTPGTNNVSAPINVGSGIPVYNLAGIQEKTNSLIIDGGLSVVGNLVISTSSPHSGYVLTSKDNIGTVQWSPSSGGAASAQTGIVTKAATSSSGTVTFPTPFATAPKVMASVGGYWAVGSCSAAGFGHLNTAGSYSVYGTGVFVDTVTPTGFTYYTPYHNDGCNKYGVSEVSWIAVGN